MTKLKRYTKEKAMERRSVIFTPCTENNLKLKHKLRAVNPFFRIICNLKLNIPDCYWFEGAYRVYDPYNDEERFLRTINNFTRVCKLGKYFYIDDDNCVWEIIPEKNLKTRKKNLQIICDDAYEVGHIMYMVLGSVVNACPELKEIMDIGCEK